MRLLRLNATLVKALGKDIRKENGELRSRIRIDGLHNTLFARFCPDVMFVKVIILGG